MARNKSNNLCLNDIDTKLPALVGGKLPVDATLTVDSLTVSEVKLLGVDSASVAPINATTGLYTDVRASVLPTGAATAAKQPALGTAGTASSDVLTVQGRALMTPLLVDGSAAIQPVSGTFYQATQPVSIASVPSHAVTNAGTFAVQVSSAPTTAVTGTFWQATQPVSGTVAVSGTVGLSTSSRTLGGGASVTTSGSVSSGAYSVTFIFSSDFAGTIAGTSFNGANDRAFVTPPLPAQQTFGAITYTVTSGSMRIVPVT